MKSLMSLVQETLSELGVWCGVSTIRDCKTIAERFEAEGLSFLTITLPNFASDLQKALEQGKVDSQLFHGFQIRRRGALPLFMGGLLGLVFDRKSGLLLDDASVDAIFAIRQACLLLSKINLPCTPKRVQRAIDKYVECEQQIRAADQTLSVSHEEAFSRMAVRLWAPILTRVDCKVYRGEIVPKHGPGTTADRLTGNGKFVQCEWPRRLEEYFPHGEYLFPNWRHYDDTSTDLLEPGKERPVRVVPVPKTLKTPRIIAIEPTAMQYVQQGLMEAIVDALDSDEEFNRPDKSVPGIIGFKDQEANQALALKGSLDNSLATLDLSEASDRVSNQHVRLLLRNHPHLLRAVDACRSRKADVPGHGVQRLAKFASMGSALTFPMEAMVFTTIIFMGIEKVLNRRLTRKELKSFSGRVRVYGDDIVIPVEFAEVVVSLLHTFGYVVNTGKSFWNGNFRESCGKEYYRGRDVSVVKVRQVLPTQRRDAQEIISTVSLRNQLYQHGLWGVARKLDELLEGMIPFPAVLPTSPILGKISFLGYDKERDCPHRHVPLVKGMVVWSEPPKSPLSGHAALMKFFLKRGELPFADRNHLERSGRPSAVRIKQKTAPSV